MSVHTKTMSTLTFFNQIRNCILRTTLCAPGAKTNNRCLSACMFPIACVCPGLPLWHLTRSPWSESQAPDWFERVGLRCIALNWGQYCRDPGFPAPPNRHTQRHTRTSAQRNKHTHTESYTKVAVLKANHLGAMYNQSQANYTPAKTAPSLCTFSSCTPWKRANPDGQPRTKLHFHFSIYLVKNSSSAEMISWLIY